MVLTAPEFFEGCVGGMLGTSAGEAPEDLLGLGGAEPEGGGVLDELVVLVLDQLPSDRPGKHVFDVRVCGLPGSFVVGRPVGAVQAYAADVLQAREKPEAEEVREGEADDGGAVGVDVVADDLRAGEVP